MKVEVAKNIGKYSSDMFGEVGTIFRLEDTTLESMVVDTIRRSDGTVFYRYPKYKLDFERPVGTIENLNDYVKYAMHPNYYTVFEEGKEGSIIVPLSDFITEKSYVMTLYDEDGNLISTSNGPMLTIDDLRRILKEDNNEN